jgi:hypothetical protein
MERKRTSLVYDVPLRSDFFAQVVVPRDLTAQEAQRLGAFLLTLAVDVSPETLSRISGEGRSGSPEPDLIHET